MCRRSWLQSVTSGTPPAPTSAGTIASVHNERWRTIAAFGTWLVVGLPEIVAIASGRFAGPQAILWTAAFLVFGAALVPCIVSWRVRRPRLIVALLVVQSAAGLTLVSIAGNGTVAATLVIVAAEVASVFPMSVAWLWIAIQTVAITAIWARFEGLGAVAVGGAFAGFQVFAASTVGFARSEREAREELGRANAELHATRSLLEENSRVSERVRIARDLHDTLGHHLTALSLQLDVASRLTSGRAADHLQEAHAIAKLLLSDVRDVVSQMRESSHLNLADAVNALTRAAGTLHIHLDMPESVQVDDAAQAHALLRCIQEIITNAARHAAAQNLWIRVERRSDGIAIHARDDGRGAAEVTWGNGLKGMRERFEEHAGRVEVSSAAGHGFEVHGFMPRAEAAS